MAIISKSITISPKGSAKLYLFSYVHVGMIKNIYYLENKYNQNSFSWEKSNNSTIINCRVSLRELEESVSEN